jgi:hypothetical protein
MNLRGFSSALALSILATLAGPKTGATLAAPALEFTIEAGPALPEAITNNAVAASTVDGHDRLFSFLGLGADRDFRAITTHAFALDLTVGRWEALPDVPGPVGRLAATAQAFGDRVYIFGGYSVAADSRETTSAAVDIYDVRSRRYSRGADIPVPVDDTVSGVWRNRLIFLINGWSVATNIDAVQIYDPALNRWSRATPIPGTPVFGHSGGIVNDVIVYCGGARVQARRTPKYAINPECFRGDIDPGDPSRVAWRRIVSHPGAARYRAAAGPMRVAGAVGVMFVGGTSNPYNYNGVGYDGQPSEPEAAGFLYDIERDAWVEGPRAATPSMDHRGLVSIGGAWWTIGGFGAGQVVSTRVTRLRPARR